MMSTLTREVHASLADSQEAEEPIPDSTWITAFVTVHGVKLSKWDWEIVTHEIESVIDKHSCMVHSRAVGTTRLHNATWCLEIPANKATILGLAISEVASEFGIGSIRWAEAVNHRSILAPSTAFEEITEGLQG